MRFLAAAVLLAVLLVLALLAVDQAECKLCKESFSSSVWKHSKGSFKKVGGKKWREFNDKNVPNAEVFEEVLKEGSSIVIRDKARNVEILLKDDVAGIKNGGEQNFQQLYAGSFIKVMDCT